MRSIILILFLVSINIGFSQNNTPNSFLNNLSFSQSFHDNTPSTNNNFSNRYKSVSDQLIENYFESESMLFFGFSNENYLKPTLSLQMADSTSVTKKKWIQTDTGKSLVASGVLIGMGFYINSDNSFINKYEVKDEINRYLPHFENPLDDYIQYAPYVAVYVMDAFGYKSKHKVLRKTTTMATAIAANLIVIQGLKYSIAEPRPDGSSDNSFPSGHTATAFMGAHIFHKEYGERSPFYSIAGYALATVTGVFRQLNDRHWISDVFAGAGFGIGVTELAYFLNGKWYGEKGINEIEYSDREINELKPSFIGVKLGYASLVETTSDKEPGISSKSGFKIATEGAYFFNKNFGVGGEIGFQSFPNTIDPVIIEEFKGYGYDIIAQSAGNRLYYTGLFYQVPFGKNAIGTKLLAGVISGPSMEIYIREIVENPDSSDPPAEETIYQQLNPNTTFGMETGVYYKRILNDNLSINAYFDYSIGDINYDTTHIDSIEDGVPIYAPVENKTANWNSYSIGASLNIMLW